MKILCFIYEKIVGFNGTYMFKGARQKGKKYFKS